MELVVGVHAVQSQEELVRFRKMPGHFQVRNEDIDDTRSHRNPGAQL